MDHSSSAIELYASGKIVGLFIAGPELGKVFLFALGLFAAVLAVLDLPNRENG